MCDTYTNMIASLSNIPTLIHFIAMGWLALYGLHRIWMLLAWREGHADRAVAPSPLPGDRDAPFVTVQLPLYNERFVAQRLIDAAAQLAWPAGRLEIQVLDDSTDDTRNIVDDRVSFWLSRDVSIKVVRRPDRSGYKAGALAHGLRLARGEFLAIFDADFLPPPDFLRKTVPCFRNPAIGMVQARWDFCNSQHSLLTEIQALLLGPHFSIEHQVRCRRGLFFNFNGTAGIWRRNAIEAAGGWSSDTVTEDLELSYRAQLAGWRFVYLDDVGVASELPVTLAAFRSQQQRWAKGSIQTARRILPKLAVAQLPVPVKREAAAHLLANTGWLAGALVTITLYPTVLSRTWVGPYQILRLDIPLFLLASGGVLLYFGAYALRRRSPLPLRHLALIPLFSIGLAPSIALAVIAGAIRRGGRFERTPKFGIAGKESLPSLHYLYRQKVLPYILLNLLLFGYTLQPVLFAIQRHTWPAIPFFLFFPLGFLLVVILDLRETLRPRAAAIAP